MITLIENTTIVTMDRNRQVIEKGFLLFDTHSIREMGAGDYTGPREGLTIVDGKDRIILPGLINAHTHSYANLVKGTTENIPLEIWMLYIMAEGKHMSREDHVISAALGSIEMLKSGTTTFLDHLAQDFEGLSAVAEQYQSIGIRAFVTPMFGDLPYADSLPEKIGLGGMGSTSHGPKSKTSASAQELIDMVEEVIVKLANPDRGIGVAVGPSGPQRSSDDLLTGSMELAQKYDLPWHTHVLETRAQEVTAQRLYQKTMVEHLAELGILNRRVSLAHGVWLSSRDMELIREFEATVVHNPASNLLLGSGVAPIIPMKEAGVRLALGTDGSNCCGFQSMFESMKLAAILSNTHTADFQRWIQAVDVLTMATQGSAAALGMEDQIGSIEAGKKADLVFLDKKSTVFVPLNNLIWQLVYGKADSCIRAVYVGGKKVVEDGKVTFVDEAAIYEEAMERGVSLLKRCQEDYHQIKQEEPKLYEMLMRIAGQPIKGDAVR
ncbi:amidohydrolase family protein [Ammoniphilus sp. YIM 78166]|uniref:amidohydrolase family protein n=1 Tax=Ammoniphilus sp. YIM 78166 TaxID=1644106 RepID=UPI0014302282|nr:amidohydrolase [Ammoniphilus sp. YIM 78166]